MPMPYQSSMHLREELHRHLPPAAQVADEAPDRHAARRDAEEEGDRAGEREEEDEVVPRLPAPEDILLPRPVDAGVEGAAEDAADVREEAGIEERPEEEGDARRAGEDALLRDQAVEGADDGAEAPAAEEPVVRRRARLASRAAGAC